MNNEELQNKMNTASYLLGVATTIIQGQRDCIKAIIPDIGPENGEECDRFMKGVEQLVYGGRDV